MSKTQPARGMRDFLPADIRRREYVIGIIKEVYESYGFEPLETPAVENLETLTGKYGEEGNQLIYKILKRGEKLEQSTSEKDSSDLALRYDLTVPLARVIAQHKNDLPKFFKRYQIQPVWRADRPARGRFREFYQCDVDVIGSSSMIVEAELCAAVGEILLRLGFSDFVIKLNHKEILTGILKAVGIPTEQHINTLVVLDKFDKIGAEAVAKELQQMSISVDSVLKLMKFILSIYKRQKKDLKDRIENIELELEKAYASTSSKHNDEFNFTQHSPEKINDITFERIAGFTSENEEGEKGISELKKILKFIKNQYVYKRIEIDPNLARGLSYYTGTIMEIVLTSSDFSGSLAGGGRYDGLIGMFGKEQIPACGFSLGLERILVVMEERGMFPKELGDSSADVLVTVWNEDSIGESLKLAGELRQQKLRVLVYPEADKLGKQFKYASQINVPFVCVLGESELAENKVTLKNMETGEQEIIERAEAASRVKIHKQNSQSKS
jgi:histidyl-tRNA synthetase